jgi:hypothetical protein
VSDGTGLAEALLGLPGLRVLEVSETVAELVVTIETTADRVGCGGCGIRAQSQDRVEVAIRDLYREHGSLPEGHPTIRSEAPDIRLFGFHGGVRLSRRVQLGLPA